MNTKLQVVIVNLITNIYLGHFASDRENRKSLHYPCQLADTCSVTTPKLTLEPKIVGGHMVLDDYSYPYQVEYGYSCSGAILAEFWVISAAHCGKKHYVKVGSKYLNRGTKYDVSSYFPHPTWLQTNKRHAHDMDILLLKLSTPIKFTLKVQPIKIGASRHMRVGQMLTVTGWGAREVDGPLMRILREVNVPVVSKKLCQKVPHDQYRHSLTENMFCAGFQNEKKDACQGDSGGPAVSNNRIYGIVSFGYLCAYEGSYGVYAKVGKDLAWLKEITGINVTD